jgi:hypothetical protein
VYTAEEVRAEAERLGQERQRAMAQAKQARRITKRSRRGGCTMAEHMMLCRR